MYLFMYEIYGHFWYQRIYMCYISTFNKWFKIIEKHDLSSYLIINVIIFVIF